MSLYAQRLGNSAVTEDLHLVLRRDETCGDKRVYRDLGERLLGGQLLKGREVDRLELNALQVGETELGETTLERHLTAFEAQLTRVTRTRLRTLVTTRGRATVTRTGTATDTFVVVR